MKESLTLSSTPPPPAASPAPQSGVVPLSVIEADVQALRTLVQSQQSQLQSLQALKDAQPLVGVTTDSAWGMALEGLVLGLVALGLGVAALFGVHAMWPGRAMARPQSRARTTSPAEFSDSMLYLADQEEDAPDSVPAVSTHLHDPLQDAKASTLAHEDGDPALEYHRMALTAQGLSVTAGAGHVDSDRVPLEPVYPATAEEKGAGSVFSPSLSAVEFDQRAAAEEVERVRRYLAQRRADRAKTALPSESFEPSVPAPTAPSPGPVADMALAVDIPLEVSSGEAACADLESWGAGAEATVVPDSLEHMSLSDGASLLAALENADAAPSPELVAAAPVPETAQPGEVMLEWDPSTFTAAGAEQDMPTDEVPLRAGPVQLALAQEFRDLGLWEEARARVLEILEQPDTGQHAQAQALLDELAQTASAPLTPQQDSPDPWGH